ncbi:MAG: NUDIX hydrolase [Myxococcota bacterium]
MAGATDPGHDGASLPLAIAVIARDERGRVLLIRRAEHLPLGGYWTPITGRLEPGEELAQAAHREVLEEVGLTIELGPELTRGPTSNGLFLLVYFTARATGGALRPDPREVAEAAWLEPAEALAREPMLATTRAVVSRALAL